MVTILQSFLEKSFMNHNKKLAALLVLAGLNTIGLQSRTSNIAYTLGADQANYAGRPMMDPTAGTNAVSADILSASGVESIFGLSIFDPSSSQMFLAETTNARDYKALVKAKVDGSVIKLTSLATSAPTVTYQNNVTPSDQTGKITTLRGKNFDRITLATTNKVALRDATTKAYIYIANGTDGSTVLQVKATDGNAAAANVDRFYEADGKLVSGLFQTGRTDYRNIPLTGYYPHGRIRVLDISTGTQIGVAKKYVSADSQYKELRLHAGSHTADNYSLQGLTTNATREVEEIGAMHWDPTLKRLFIAFSRPSDEPLASADSAPIIVGRFADGTEAGTPSTSDLLVEPFAPAGAASTGGSKVVSFYNSKKHTIPFLNMMHVKATKTDATEIDLPYLIAQINYDITADSNTCGRIFAIPVVSSNSATAANLGKAANVDSITSATPATLGQLAAQDPTFATGSDVRALVGGGRVPVLLYSDIKALQVVGHTVLVGTIGASAAAQIGIWASTAVIDSTGAIMGWTPWTRAYGIYEQVYGLGVEQKTGKAWVVHADVKGAAATTVAGVSIPDFENKLTAPKNVDGLLPEDNSTTYSAAKGWDICGLASISDKINADFGGKIFASRHFQANRTPGLSTKSLLAVCGEGKLALACTGAAANASTSIMDAGTATTNRDFEVDIATTRPDGVAITAANTLYQFFDASNQDELAALGNIYCVEVARSRATNQGWLFAGGDNGLVVFSNDSTGLGWESIASGATGLSNLKTVFSTLNAKKIDSTATPISGPVIALNAVSKQTDGSASADDSASAFLLVLTKTGLYRVPMSATNFQSANVGNITTVEKLTLPDFASDELCISMKMISHHANSVTGGAACGILVTTKGFYTLNNLEKVKATAEAGINKVTFADADFSSKIRRVEILPISPYNATILSATGLNTNSGTVSGTRTIANLIITTGTLTEPESEIYLVPLSGTQLVGYTTANVRQAAYTLDTTVETLTPLLLASKSSLGSSKAFGTASLSYPPLCAFSKQTIAGNKKSAHLDIIGQSEFASLAERSFSSMSVNGGGNGGLLLTDRSGGIISQE